MKIVLTVVVDDAKVNLDNYSTDGVEEAVKSDAVMYEEGEIGFEEFVYGYNGDVVIESVAIIHEEGDRVKET